MTFSTPIGEFIRRKLKVNILAYGGFDVHLYETETYFKIHKGNAHVKGTPRGTSGGMLRRFKFGRGRFPGLNLCAFCR